MKVKLAFALIPLILCVTPIYAEGPCLQCLNASQEELKKCLDEAISQEDKMSCEEKQEARAKTCESGECKIEREQAGGKSGGLPAEK
jgi:hypothetical protein